MGHLCCMTTMSNAFDDVNGYQEKFSISAFIRLCFAPCPQISLISSGPPTTQEKITVENTGPWNIGWEVGAVNSNKCRAVWMLWLIRKIF